MPKTTGTHKGSIIKYKPPQADEDKFYQLFDILHDTCFGGNYNATARALGISPITAKRWSKNPPKRYWEMVMLHRTVRDVIKYMQSSVHQKYRKQATTALIQLRRQDLETLAEELEVQSHFQSEALVHLISTIAWEPKREISTAKLFKAANNGGFTRQLLSRTAKELQLKKTPVGFGEDKEAWYSIPHPDDL